MNPTPCLAASQGGLPATPARRPGLGYRFVPVPKFVHELISSRKLAVVDSHVLAAILQFRRRNKASCWTSKAVLARAINRTPRTIQRSFARMISAGVIEHQYVGPVDPDDPMNRTGWRIVFPWLLPQPSNEPGPASAGGTIVSPRATVRSRGGATVRAPKFARVHAPLKILDGPNQETTSSSSQRRDDDDASLCVVGGRGAGAADPEAVAAVQAELAALGPSLAEQFGRRAPMIVEAASASSVSAAAAVREAVVKVAEEIKHQGGGIRNATAYTARALAGELEGRLDVGRIRNGLKAITGQVAADEIRAEGSRRRLAMWEAEAAKEAQRKAEAAEAAKAKAEADHAARQEVARARAEATKARRAEEARRAEIEGAAKQEWERLPDAEKLAAVDRLGPDYSRRDERMKRWCFHTAFTGVFLPEFLAQRPQSAGPPAGSMAWGRLTKRTIKHARTFSD